MYRWRVLSGLRRSTSREEVSFCSLIVMLEHPEITESFGGNYCSEFWGFWTLCDA